MRAERDGWSFAGVAALDGHGKWAGLPRATKSRHWILGEEWVNAIMIAVHCLSSFRTYLVGENLAVSGW